VPSAKQRQRLLHEALEVGIRHFDIARMYGLGRGENELGKFAAGRRDRIVIATKFGIELSATGGWLGQLQFGGRYVVSKFPALRGMIRRRTARLYQPRRYDADIARRSLETSLRELRTDYVDLLFLHEPKLAEIVPDELVAFLERCQRDGTVRAFGVSGYVEDVRTIGATLPRLARIVQFASDVFGAQREQFEAGAEQAVLTFSPLSAALPRISALCRQRPSLLDKWARETGIDFGKPANLVATLVQHAVMLNPTGTVVFSSTNPDRLRQAVRAANEPLFRPDALSRFIGMLRQEAKSEERSTLNT
jgi:D-threo-aldose 1-dehydrogenase